jgi:hypothetical protein
VDGMRVGTSTQNAANDARLLRLEAAIDEHHTRIGRIEARTYQQNVTGGSTCPPGFQSSTTVTPQRQEYSSERIHFLIPQEHKTSTTWLLSSPEIEQLLGHYPKHFFFQIESKHVLPESLTRPDVQELSDATLCSDEQWHRTCEQYFRAAHVYYPVLSRNDLEQYRSDVQNGGDEVEIKRAVLSLIETLCTLSTIQSLDWLPAYAPLASAMRVLNHHLAWSFRNSIELAQALVLASSCFAYLARPLHSWRYAQIAYNCLEYVSDSDDSATQSKNAWDERQRRIYWACFLIEWYV